MIWAILIGGQGTRTRALGEFKPFVEILGHRMLSWLLCSIKHNVRPDDTFVFCCEERHVVKHDVEAQVTNLLRSHGLHNLSHLVCDDPNLPPGPSGGLYSARSMLDTDEPVAVVCCDRYIDFDLPSPMPAHAAFVPIDLDFTGTRTGYVEIEAGKILRLVEGAPVSYFHSTGAWIVSEAHALVCALEGQFACAKTHNDRSVVHEALNHLPEPGYTIYPLPLLACYNLGDLPGIERFVRTPLAASLSRTMPGGERRVV